MKYVLLVYSMPMMNRSQLLQFCQWSAKRKMMFCTISQETKELITVFRLLWMRTWIWIKQIGQENISACIELNMDIIHAFIFQWDSLIHHKLLFIIIKRIHQLPLWAIFSHFQYRYCVRNTSETYLNWISMNRKTKKKRMNLYILYKNMSLLIFHLSIACDFTLEWQWMTAYSCATCLDMESMDSLGMTNK